MMFRMWLPLVPAIIIEMNQSERGEAELVTYDCSHSRVRYVEVGRLLTDPGTRQAPPDPGLTTRRSPGHKAGPGASWSPGSSGPYGACGRGRAWPVVGADPHRGHHGGGVEPREHHRVRGHRVQVGLVGGPELAGDLGLGLGDVGNAAFDCDHTLGVETADVADRTDSDLCVRVLGKLNGQNCPLTEQH